MNRLISFLVASVFAIIFSYTTSVAAVVDLMLVYDTKSYQYIEEHNGGMKFTSQNIVNRLNQVFANSGMSHSIRLAHDMTVEYSSSYTEYSNHHEDLRELSQGNGNLQSVHIARDAYNADLVALIVYTNFPTGGTAYTLTSWEGSPSGGLSASSLWSVLSYDSLSHELGHNLGALHSKYQLSSPGPNQHLDNQYSAGWYFTGTDNTDYHTIMAYTNDGYGNSYTPAPVYSSPTIVYQGSAVGNAQHGDNCRLINQTIGVVEKYRNANVSLVALEIEGPNTLASSSHVTYEAIATWSDNSSTRVFPEWTIIGGTQKSTSIKPPGFLSLTPEAGQSYIISASFTNGSVTLVRKKSVQNLLPSPRLTELPWLLPLLLNKDE